MRRAVRSPRLDHARPPLARLLRRDWIWRGVQALDGVFAPATASPETLRRLLDRVETVLESEDGALALFAAPIEIDCASLGAALPLKRLHGALAAFPFDAPADADIEAATRDRLLLMRGGTPVALPLERFRPRRWEDWIDLGPVTVESASSPPIKAGARAARALPIDAGALVGENDARAGFEDLRARIGEPEGDGRSPSMSGAAWLAAAGVLALVAMFAGGGVGSLLPVLASALAVAAALWGGGWLIGAWGAIDGDDGDPSPSSRPADDRRSLWRLLPWAAAALAVLAGLASRGFAELLSGVAVSVAIGVGVILLSSVLAGLFSLLPGLGGARGRDAPTSDAAAAPPPAERYRGPNWLRRALDRLLRHTPATGFARDRYARRVEELKRLFAEGRIDEALKKALAVDPRDAPPDPVHADQPVRGPGVREQLRIHAVQPPARGALAALPPGSRAELQALYRAEAARCASAGQADRAAFILAELLDDAAAAVQVYVAAERFDVAARLAQGRRLPPGVFIPLWYRAGARETALLLAERHGAYEVLLASTQTEDAAFRDEIRRRWSARLARVGALGEALAVSAPLASAGDAAMRERRRAWMAEGLALDAVETDLLARALKAASAGDDKALDADPTIVAFEALLAAPGAAAARRRKQLAEHLLDPAFEPAAAPAFAAERLPWIASRLPRRMLRDHRAHGIYTSITLPSALAEAGGESTLAADLRRLPRRLGPARPSSPRVLKVGPIRGAAAVVAAAPMRGDRLVVALEDGGLRLIDGAGRELWRDQVWRPRDIIAVSPGRLALVIRDEPGERRLSIIDIETRRHAEIGPVALDAWASWAEPDGWLVAVDGAALNLRVDPLAAALSGAPPASLERHWATPITVEGRILRLLRDPEQGDAMWLFQRQDGVLERWRVAAQTLQVSYNVLGVTGLDSPCSTADLARFDLLDASGRLSRVHARALAVTAEVAPIKPPPIHLHARARPFHAVRLAPRVGGEGQPPGEPRFALVAENDPLLLEIAFEGARVAHMREGRESDRIALWDDVGRIVVMSSEAGAPLYANVGVREADAPASDT